MVKVSFSNKFEKILSKIKDSSIKERIIKQISKIKEYPEIGKPMKYERKDTREVYVSPFRLAYAYLINENKVIILDLYHKDEQ